MRKKGTRETIFGRLCWNRFGSFGKRFWINTYIDICWSRLPIWLNRKKNLSANFNNDVEVRNVTPNIVFSTALKISSSQKIEAKHDDATTFFLPNGCFDVIMQQNCLKLKRAQLYLCENFFYSFVKIDLVLLSNGFGHTHTHTDRHTHTHIHSHTHKHTYIHTHIRTITQKQTDTYTHIHTQTITYTHTHTHTDKDMYTHRPIYTQTYQL